MRSLRWAGVVSSLLIVGVLGGLVAALPSEASAPSITISVDATAGGFGSVTDVPIPFDAVTGGSVANGVACSSADAVNYNICYKITTFDENGLLYGPAQRQFKIMNAIGTDNITQDARLLISDCAGANCLEKMVLTGVRIVPATTFSNASLVKVTLKFRNIFDFAPNDTTLGDATSSYRLPLSITGVFKDTAITCTNAATAGCPVNNEMHMWGRGIFCTSTNSTDCPAGSTGTKAMDLAGGGGNSANVDRTTCTVSDSPLCRMYMKVANIATQDVRLDKSQQGVDYPSFRCNNGLSSTPTFNPLTSATGSVSGKKCVADVTAFLEFKLYGADTVNLDGSPRMAGGNCGTPKAPPCNCTGGGGGKKQCLDEKIAGFVEDEERKAKLVQVGIPDAIFCDPVTICNGTINNFIQVTPLPSTVRSFPFTAIGPDVDNFSITSNPGMAPPFTNAFTGPGGTVRVIAPDYNNPSWPRPDGNSFYAVDQIHVTDVNGNNVGPPAVEVFSCSGGNKGPLIIHDLRGTYNILFHIHNSQQPGTLCQ